MLYQVKDLSPEQRRAAEILLGHPVSEDDTVSIKSLGPTTIIPPMSPEDRVEALRALEKRFATANRPDVGEEEEEAIANEGCDQPAPIIGRPVENRP